MNKEKMIQSLGKIERHLRISIMVSIFLLVLFICVLIVPPTINTAGGIKEVIVEDSTTTVSSWTEWKEFEATAYTHKDAGCNRYTKTEHYLCPSSRIVAVDPNIIPLHSRVEIQGFGLFYAEDIGGAIKSNRIDIFCWDIQAALEFGRRKVNIRWESANSSQ